MRDTAPADPVALLTDHLPSLLAWPDSEVLRLIEPFVYHPNDLVRQYTMHALYLFDDALVSGWVPRLIGRRGPTTELAYFVSWRRDLFGARAGELAGLLIPHLRTAHAAAALRGLLFCACNTRRS